MRDKSRKPLALVAGLCSIAAFGCTSTEPCADGPTAGCGEQVPPTVTAWTPVGARTVGNYDYGIIPEPNAFHTMHVGPNNGDNVWIATAPKMELAWTAETSFYVAEGPTYDNEGNLYFSPLFPQEDVSLVSLDAATGERNWEIQGNGSNAGSGAILILNDPDNPGQQVIYHLTFTEAMALKPDGSEIWRVATGLTLPPVVPGERSTTHSFGFNYHPQTDSVVGLTMNGEMLAFDRATGTRIAPIGQIPGSPAASVEVTFPQFVIDASNQLTDAVFGKTPSGLSFWSLIVDVIFGGGSVVTNYFGIDPNTGLMYVAATADDAADGTEDGVSDLGAIYSVDLIDDGNGGLKFQVLNDATFVGGTGSTPTISEDGRKVFVSDNLGNVIALDSDLDELWRYDVGEPLAASVAVSPDNGEIFVVTRRDVFKLSDHETSATLDWKATFDAFADDPDIEVEFQALTPTITANGIAVSVGGGKLVSDREVMLKVGVGLLDRETGELRSFAEGREESIAVTSVAPDGGIYTASSPVRRVSGKALFPDLAANVIGGISRYRPVRNDLLAQDASCAAGVRARNAATIVDSAPASAAEDMLQIRALIAQSRAAIARADSEGDLDTAEAASLDTQLEAAEANVSATGLEQAAAGLIGVCNALAAPQGDGSNES
ncbi:MAG: PQQ-binding-like beta-propeller repeat protein [Polyangiales bacterium]